MLCAAFASAWRSCNIHFVIPNKFRVGHEAHFAQVATHFFDYVRSPGSLPAWERAFMLAKYYVCAKGVELSRLAAPDENKK